MTAVADRPSDGVKVALVTPSLNQGTYLGAAIDSVLRQTHPEIDYLVVDGGSRDNSLDVLRSYGDRVRWISEPDGGQSDAIHKGFLRTEGEILGWLNADDLLDESAVERVVSAFRAAPGTGLVYGDGLLIDEAGIALGPFAEIEPFHHWRLLFGLDYILQPAAFFRRRVYEMSGGLAADLSWAMDWDLWIRLAAAAEVEYLPATLASSRIWSGTKTTTGGWKRLRELRSVTRRHTGKAWTPGVWLYTLDTLRAELARLLPRRLRPLGEALIHRSMLRVATRMACYPDGWLGPDGCLALPRRWRQANLTLQAVELPADREMTLKLALDGRALRTLTFAEPGSVRLSVEIPRDRQTPFCRLDLVSSYWFRTPRDRRRLAVRLVELEGV